MRADSGSRSKLQKSSNYRDHTNLSFLFLFIILAATALRLYQLNTGLWLDEILTFVKYARLTFGEIVTTFDSENQHFLYSILAHISFMIFGESAWALRLPAVLFGVGSIWTLYLLGNQVASRTEGLLAAALLAFSYHHVWFSQNARGYTGLLFWTILSSWLFVRGLIGEHAKIWIYYAIAVALGVYTHLTMGFVLVGHIVLYLVLMVIRWQDEWSQRWLGIFLGTGLAGLLSLLLYAPIIPQILNTIGGTEQSVVTAWKNPLWTLLELASGLKISFAGGILAAGAILLFGLGFLWYALKEPILLGLLFFPPIIGTAVTLVVGHHLWPRFFFFEFGLAALVLVRGASVLGEFIIHRAGRFMALPEWSSSWAGRILPIGLILVSAFSVPLAYGPKQDYGGALNFVNANLQPGDAVTTVFLTEFVYKEFYKTGWEVVNSLESLNAVRTRSTRTWLLYTFPPVIEAMHPDVMASIQSDFVLIEQFEGTVSNGTVYVVRADEPPTELTVRNVGH